MSERPTLRQIIAVIDQFRALHPDSVLAELCNELEATLDGCVIAHPDDVRLDASLAESEYGRGFNDCHDLIFGGSHE